MDIESIIKEALKRPKVKEALKGKEIKKVIYVPNKVINFATRKLDKDVDAMV